VTSLGDGKVEGKHGVLENQNRTKGNEEVKRAMEVKVQTK
jgi:hypothetical protein